MIRMMSLTLLALLAEFPDISMTLVEILLMVVAVVAFVPPGLLVLSLIIHIGASQVTATGNEPPDPASTATSYS